jgi:hypothetical protein
VSGTGLAPAAGETIFWLAVLSSIVAEIAILRAVFRTRSVAARPAAAPDERSLPRVRRGAEILWAVLPALALALVLVMTWRAMRAGHVSPDPAPRAAVPADRTGAPG